MAKLDKEKIVRDLVNTFEDRDKLHIAYKQKIKEIIVNFIEDYAEVYEELRQENIPIEHWIDIWVESHFKPEQ